MKRTNKNKVNLKLPSNRKFGIFFTFVLALLSVYFYVTTNMILTYIFLLTSLTLLGISIIKADVLFPLNKLWMKLGFLLGKIINPIVLGMIFFVLITPFGFIIRLFGRDELRLRIKNNNTYWKNRSQNLQQTNFRQQF